MGEPPEHWDEGLLALHHPEGGQAGAGLQVAGEQQTLHTSG